MFSTVATARGRRSPALPVIVLCWLVMIFDGFDVIMYGTIVPTLLRYEPWGVTPEEAGAIGAYALVGMLIGAMAVGTLTDLLGRRRLLIGCLAWFSVAMGFAAVAPSPELFGLARFVAGIGLGGVLPTASALTMEYAPAERRTFVYAVMFSGYPLGGLLAAVIAIPVVPALGFRGMTAIGAAALLVLPWLLRSLPESPSFLAASGRHAEAAALAARYDIPLPPPSQTSATATEGRAGRLAPLAELFRRHVLKATLLFWAATFLCLLLIYGLYTWLPEIMQRSGFPLGSVSVFLVVLNLGGTVGMIGAARAADRFGVKVVTIVACGAAAVAISLLSLELPLLVNYLLVVVAGTGVIGCQILINAFVGTFYPASSRATALGWSLGVGRIGAIAGPSLGGLIVGSGLDVAWNFYFFGLAALAATVLIAMIPARPADPRERPDTAASTTPTAA